MIDATGMPETAVVLGGYSEIGLAVVRRLADRRLRAVLLVGRDEERLARAGAEVRAFGVAKVETSRLDLGDLDAVEGLAADATARLGEVDLVLVAAGSLGTADLGQLDARTVGELFTANCTGPAAAMLVFARALVAQGSGRIVLLSSVAGLRVRRANFVYGAAKAGADGFAQGLGDALAGTGVEVTIVRPGFVRTRMTAGLPDAPLATDAASVAGAVVRGLETGAAIVYVPPLLRPIFAGMRMLPRALWRKVPG